MKGIVKSYDINAHIEDVECEIVVENGDVIAVIAFKNLGYGDITAVKFNAVGYNSFGDVVPIGNKEKFFLIIQDIMIKKNEKADNLKAKLPASDIRKLSIEESQICYADGSVTTYKGQNIKEIELQEFDYTQQEEVSAVHKLYDERIKYDVFEFDEGWICGCGRFNKTETDLCTLCGKNKEKTKSILSPDGLKRLVEEYRSRISVEQEEARLKSIVDEKAAKQKKIKIAIGTVIAVIVAILMGNFIVMSGRTTYSSAEEMKEALQGTYTYYSDNGKASRQIVISGDKAIYKWSHDENDMETDIKDWNYKRGTIHTFEDIIVTNEGDLKNDGDIYEKGGYMSTGSSYSNSYSSESGYSVLKITADSVSSNSSYTICTGSVKNTGTKTYYYIEVKGAFKDSSGDVIDTDWTYAAGSEGLAPGESTTFRLSVTKDYDIESCTVSLSDFD